ncbi:hypothetical protein A2W24_03580 [Microgenomates group bacterium RBG_16_45_19]|nr:MAG: hypothetical protein A2W24_03580 [Microgenomates group bacterium RBG_16_45_19]
MPALDQTGPQGMGPLTGRGFGPCGRGMGYGRRMGYGRGLNRYFGIKDLQDYQTALKEELEEVEEQLADLQKSA